MTQTRIRVRHSTFGNMGWATGETRKKFPGVDETIYPACFVEWDDPRTVLNTIVANFNLVFIVPAPSRKQDAAQ